MKRHFAKKTCCNAGHVHDSKAEAKRCDDLCILERAGQILALKVHPRFPLFANDRDVKMGNGQVARYTGDFSYIEGNRQVVEDVKAKNGFVERDFPLRIALARACYPDIEFRVVK